ncbi:Serine/threonine-protein kinase rio2 [Phytophthora palmivora]|uniref:Serine/threonine-protein kinase rio2 n=1 Tax=Phytophthora palmivora TaxID=4796 RepID=A0A2P4Y7W6_9STRA|nr:Serine/threonine-protein kinase rio2 [Phytophthora palmivora]
MNIKVSDIVRFSLEPSTIKWCQMNIQFLDEVSFDNRVMVRSRGYCVAKWFCEIARSQEASYTLRPNCRLTEGVLRSSVKFLDITLCTRRRKTSYPLHHNCLKGKKLAFRGEFNRKARVSLLCFISLDGLVESFHTDGTFDRSKFVECCRVHAHSGKTVYQYPRRGFIHCHPDIVYYLRSLGIILIFLPAYYPFYNPIEYLFNLIKKAFKRQYVEGFKQSQAVLIANVLQQFQDFDMTSIFEHCGWSVTGEFDCTSAVGDEYVSTSQA